MRVSRLVLLLILSISSLRSQSVWTQSTSGVDYSLTGITYGKGKFVVIASVGSVLSSADGFVWTLVADRIPGALGLRGVAFGNGSFVAVGANGIIFRSQDGVAWTASFSGTSADLNAIAFGDSEGFAAAGAGGRILTSRDGVTWQARTSTTTNTLFGIASSRGAYVAVGYSYTIVSSPDGIAWSNVGGDKFPINWGYGGILGGVVFGGPFVVAVGSNSLQSDFLPARSANSITWTSQPAANGFFDGAVTFGNNRYVAVASSGGSIGVSADGFAWVRQFRHAFPLPGGHFGAITFGNDLFIAVGDSGVILRSPASSDPIPTPPVIISQPKSVSVGLFGSVALNVAVSGVGPFTYQWQTVAGGVFTNVSGNGIVGGTTSSILYRTTVPTNGQSYVVRITNGAGSVISSAAEVRFGGVSQGIGRLVNLSIRTAISDATPSFILGTVVGATGTIPLLFRAAGPALSSFGISNAIADPKLDVFLGSNIIATNDNWGGGADISAEMAKVGAFPFGSPSSRDAAVYRPAFAANAYTVQVSGVGGNIGEVLAEVYDSTTPATAAVSYTLSSPRLVNVSVRKQIDAGATLIAGFVIRGATARTILIRAIGPGLIPFGVNDSMADPTLGLYDSGGVKLLENGDWGGVAQFTSAAAVVGAFPIANAASKDSMILTSLAPGAYTAQVTGTAAGTVLVEVYEVP